MYFNSNVYLCIYSVVFLNICTNIQIAVSFFCINVFSYKKHIVFEVSLVYDFLYNCIFVQKRLESGSVFKGLF